jgi:superfamily II DNA helicase RecQ
MTVEQPFRSRAGHLLRPAILLRSQSFQKHVVRIVVGEAYNIHTACQPHDGLDAFRPAWGLLEELKAILPHTVRWAFLLATFPPHIRAMIEKRTLRSGYVAIHTTLDRSILIFVDNMEPTCRSPLTWVFVFLLILGTTVS